ncbi:aryl hydrocarbon receptor 1a isoform X1 [Lepisosteus oculatus]|uniref:aryl hydrocarbon receptor 1a isoform X1 n=1 Tax=Lepisosteus oculatus TaxID=7918 RepID=UPI0035F52F78
MSNSTSSIYASRKRRKPVQKSTKPAPPEGAKSNPSKRHRDRLNAELERLANLLPFPQDVISKLDKLSVLRLSVSYLRAKSFFSAALKPNGGRKPDGNGLHDLKHSTDELLEGELLLQVLNGFVLVVTAEGAVFYASSTIQDYLGFNQSDVIHQSVYDLIHTEDRAEFQRQLHWALNPQMPPDSRQAADNEPALPLTYYSPEHLPPENSTFLERNFVCRLRCLLDNSSGFLAMNFQGRLKFLHGQNRKSKDGSAIPPQLALFALAAPLQPPSILEIRTKNFIFRTKHKLDFTPTACDAKGKIVLGYTEAELCYRGTGYQFIHAADMLYCAENHIRMIKTGESGMTVFRLLTKKNRWTWVQANARLVYKNGRPDYIIATQRALTDEEGLENFKKRNLKLPFSFATGEAVLYETTFSMSLNDPTLGKAKTSLTVGGSLKITEQESLDPNSLLGAMLKQDESVYVCSPAQNTLSLESSIFGDTREDLNDILSRNWQDSLLSVSRNNLQTQQPDDSSLDSKSSDLFSFMKNLDICMEDLEILQQDEEFLKVDWDEPGDITNVADEILSYVQESLNKKSDCMYSSCAQQKLPVPNPSCMLQQLPQPPLQLQLPLQQQSPQYLQPQPQPRQYPPPPQLPQPQPQPQPHPLQQQNAQYLQQQQLCQKLRHMQVNGMHAAWAQPAGAPSASCQQQPAPLHLQQHNHQYSPYGLESTVSDYPYKSEISILPTACNQDFMPYKPAVPAGGQPQPANLANVSCPVTELNTQELEDFLESLEPLPKDQECIISPQTCYTGAMSMYQYLPESQSNCTSDPNMVNQMLFSPLGQQPFLAKFQNENDGSSSSDAYPESFGMMDCSQPTQPLHHH